MTDFKSNHWALLNLQYEYLDYGYKLTATTDVPCHLYCRMTTTPPRKHSLPSMRRGLRITGDIRFCFVVYEDNEQDEAGDTLTHTWLKTPWPVCEDRWFYFVGEQGGSASVSETAIFKFHFPAPPPEPPAPILRQYLNSSANRSIRSNWGTWPPTRNGIRLSIPPQFADPPAILTAGHYYTVSYWLFRSFLDFGEITLPSPAIIVGAWLSIFVTDNPGDMPAKPDLIVEAGLQSDPVVVNDWYSQNPITAVLGQISRADLIVGQYNDIPFTQAGFDYVTSPSKKKFCLLSQYDIENVAPFPIANSYAYVSYNSDQKGPGYRPILKIQYYPA